MQFKIEQIAFKVAEGDAAQRLMNALGLDQWLEDVVVARGKVFDKTSINQAKLNYNYQAAPAKPLELETLRYEIGPNWLMNEAMAYTPLASHIGTHCTEVELSDWTMKLRKLNMDIDIVQDVKTLSHENPAISGTRRYHYRIFRTRHIIGVDLKFIVRMELA